MQNNSKTNMSCIRLLQWCWPRRYCTLKAPPCAIPFLSEGDQERGSIWLKINLANLSREIHKRRLSSTDIGSIYIDIVNSMQTLTDPIKRCPFTGYISPGLHSFTSSSHAKASFKICCLELSVKIEVGWARIMVKGAPSILHRSQLPCMPSRGAWDKSTTTLWLPALPLQGMQGSC